MALDSWNFSSPDGGGMSAPSGSGGLSSSTFSAAGGAVQDIYAGKAAATTAAGQRLEAERYDAAAKFARQNKVFTEVATGIKEYQQDRTLTKVLGGQATDVAGAGFEASGSALDILRDSASQGALARGVLSMQGAIEEIGYEEQAKNYDMMAQASRMSADASDKAAEGAVWGATLKGAAAGASAGSMFGPWGTVIGAGVGAVAGYAGASH